MRSISWYFSTAVALDCGSGTTCVTTVPCAYLGPSATSSSLRAFAPTKETLVKMMSDPLSLIFSMSFASALYVGTQTTARRFGCLDSSATASETSEVLRWYPTRKICDGSRLYLRMARATPSKPASP